MTQPSKIGPEILLKQTDWLRFLARQLVRGQDDQDDLVQETYLLTLRRPPEDANRLSAFMTQVMRRLAIRRGQRESQRPYLESLAVLKEVEASPQELVERLTIQRDLVDGLLGISDSHRDVLILRFYEDLGPTEIAARLEIPLATAKSKLQRGIIELRQIMTSKYGDQEQLNRSLAPIAVLASLGASKQETFAAIFLWAKIAAVIAFVTFTSWTLLEFNQEQGGSDQVEMTEPAGEELTPKRVGPSRAQGSTPMQVQEESKANAAHQVEMLGVPSIQVLDEKGRGIAGVPVKILSRILDRKSTAWKGKTKGAAGTVAVVEVLKEIKEKKLCAINSITLGFPCLKAPLVKLGQDLSADWPAKLRMPLTGSLKITILDERKELYSGRIRVSCGGGTPAALTGVESKGSLTTYDCEVEGGVLDIPYVGLGLTIFLRTQDMGSERPNTLLRFLGPVKKGETLVKSVTLLPNYPVVRGKLKFPNNDRLGLTSLQGVIIPRGKNGAKRSTSLRLGASVARSFVLDIHDDGSFQGIWRRNSAAVGASTLHVGERVELGGNAVGIRASVPVLLDPSKSVIDVGEIALESSPTLVVGRVVDDMGQPLSGVAITASVKKVGTRRRSNQTVGFALSDSKGMFTLRGKTDTKEIVLKAKAHGYVLGDEVVLKVGQKEANLMMHRLGSLGGSITFAKPLEAWPIHIQTTRREDGRAHRQTRKPPLHGFRTTVENGGIKSDGSFVLPRLEAGIYTVWISKSGQLVNRIDSLTVRAGEISFPKELKNIKLGKPIRPARITLQDEKGIPLAGKWIKCSQSSQGASGQQSSAAAFRVDEAGSFLATKLGSNQDTVDIVVWGYKPATVNVKNGNVTLKLKPGPIVNLELPSFKNLESKGTKIKVTLYRGMQSFRDLRDPKLRLLSGARYDRILQAGKATFQLSGTGKFMVRVELLEEGRRRGTPVKSLEPLSFQVREGVQSLLIRKKEK